MPHVDLDAGSDPQPEDSSRTPHRATRGSARAAGGPSWCIPRDSRW